MSLSDAEVEALRPRIVELKKGWHEQEQGRDHAELVLLYETCVADIANFKQRQIDLVNYTFLFFAAYIGAHSLIAVHWIVATSLTLLTLITTAYTCSLHFELGVSLEIRRDRMKKLRLFFSDSFQCAWETKATKPEEQFSWMMLVALAVGTVTTVLIIWVPIVR